MKVAIQIAAYTDLSKACIQMENNYLLISDIFPLCNDVKVIKSGSACNIYVSIDKTVQNAGTIDAGTFTQADKFQVLTDDGVETYRGFNPVVSVSQFNRGITYLIPVSLFAPLRIIPNILTTPIGGTSDTFVATKYLYQCVQDTDVLNTTSLSNCTTVNFLGAVAAAKDMMKASQKRVQMAQFAASVNIPIKDMSSNTQIQGARINLLG